MNKKGIYTAVCNIKIDIYKLLMFVFSVCALTVFINNRFGLLLGPIMACILAYLFFSGYAPFVTAIIIVANDALGTILGNSISFAYLLILFVIFDVIQKNRLSQERLVILLVATYFVAQLYLVEFISFREVICSVAYIMALLNISHNWEEMTLFFRGIILTVTLLALHALFTGGVEYYELNIYSQEVLRKGILGVGIGDSNYSSFLLAIGLICTWCEKHLHIAIKIVITALILYALLITLSVSGLLAVFIILFVGALFGENKRRNILIITLFLLIMIVFLLYYFELPEEMRNETFDAYLGRLEEKYIALTKGDYSKVTTYRSDLFTGYLKYIFIEQPILPLLFGGNSLNIVHKAVPHNTYIGVILQVGLFGAIAFFYRIAFKAKETLIGNHTFVSKKQMVLLKVLCLFMATNLSFYSGSLWCMWFYFLIVL